MKFRLLATFSASLLTACGGSDGGSEVIEPSQPLIPLEPSTPVTYQASSSAMINGALSPSSQAIQSGEAFTFTVVPDNGYSLASISGCEGTLQDLSYHISAISADCEISATFSNNAQNAVDNEDHTLASAAELIEYSKAQIVAAEAQRSTVIELLYSGIDSNMSWFPSHDSITYSTFKPEKTFVVLPSNVNASGEEVISGLVMAGEFQGQRYAAMGANLFSVNTGTETDALLDNLLNWLTQGENLVDGLSVVTAHVPSKADSWYFQHNEGIRSWLESNYPDSHSINDAGSCDYSALIDCISSHQPDVIIISDTDQQELGYEGIESAIAVAKAAGIPLLLSNYRRYETSLLTPIYREMGLIGTGNYWSKNQVVDLSIDDIKAPMAELQAVDSLLDNLRNESFDNSVLDACTGNYINCSNDAFNASFKSAADWYRNSAVAVDGDALALFSGDDMQLFKAGLLIADKYRSGIDYPIDYSDTANWQKAMFADWVVSYVRENNLAQADLGEFITDKNNLSLGSNAHYAYPATITDREQFSMTYSGNWTTTGWYALPGQRITLTRHDSGSAAVNIKLNYHRANTNRAFSQLIYRAPLELAQHRLTLDANSSLSFSSPYGGPIYVYLSGSESPLTADISVTGAAQHPSIMDFSDNAQVETFNTLINDTQIPHVDLRNDGAEQHLRRDRFLGAISDSVPDVTTLLESVAEDHINNVYTLAGFKIQGKTLNESLPSDVLTACLAQFGNDCVSESLHTRETIQHANYDQNAHCGSGCSGNPWDSSGNISPTGWLDNHELGHNLQVKRLNVHYVTAENSDSWSSYASRAGENSNNIFPYFVKWKAHYLRDGNTDTITDGHMNHKDLFYVFMSDAANTVDANGDRVVYDRSCNVLTEGQDRYSAPWASNAYATNNGYRMSFYFQMMLKAHGMTLSNGSTLDNGFNIMTLLYLQQRLFGQYSGDIISWLAYRDKLGFSLFDYDGNAIYDGNTVANIPGNDFMLVALSQLTGKDWRSHFDMFGLHYSTLAAEQVVVNAGENSMPMGMYELENEVFPIDLSDGLTFIPLSLADATTKWKGVDSPTQCGQ